MRTLRLLAMIGLLVTTAGNVGEAHSTKHKGLEVVHPWTFETRAAGGAEIVRMKIRSDSAGPDSLIEAASPNAVRVDIVAGDGATSIQVPAGATVELGRDGPHLVLVGLNKRLGAYDHVPLTLTFEKAGKIKVEVMVEERNEPAADPK